MKLLNHFKLASKTGFILGLLIAIIDLLIRIAIWSFEWVEFYQTLIIYSIFFTILFILLFMLLNLIKIFIKVRLTKKWLSIFYLSDAVIVFLFYYIGIYANLFLLSKISLLSLKGIIINLILISILLALYITLLTIGKKITYQIISILSKKVVKKIVNNFLFAIIIFIIISFVMDIYLLNYNAPSTLNPNLDGYPNIILITLDTTRADHLSLYGYPYETTPHLDKLGKDSVVFENAISTSSWTLPAHASIFTGKNPSNHKATNINQILSFDEITLAEILRKQGYNTAGFSSNIFTKAKYGMAQGFTTYKDRLDFLTYRQSFTKFNLMTLITFLYIDFNKYLFVDAEKTSEEQNELVFSWLDKNHDKPFFMFIQYFDPHSPYNLGGKYIKQYTNKSIRYKEVEKVTGKALSYLKYPPLTRNKEVSQELIDYIIALYDSELSYLDENLGILFKKLEQLDIIDDTIIIIVGDHGEEFYDHGAFVHGFTLYEEVIHVPFIIYYPKELPSKRINQRVSIIDIFPTILSLVNINIPENIDGVDLLDLIKINKYDREFSLSELYGIPGKHETTEQKAISDNNWKLIEVNPDIESIPSSLFNLKTDPEEKRNIIDTFQSKREELSSNIDELTENE